VTERDPEVKKESLKKKESIRTGANFKERVQKFEIENKMGVALPTEETEAKLSMQKELKELSRARLHSQSQNELTVNRAFLETSIQRLSISNQDIGSRIMEAPPTLNFSEPKAHLDVVESTGIKKSPSSPELNSPEEDAGLNLDIMEPRANSICNGKASASSASVKRVASLHNADRPASAISFKDELSKTLTQEPQLGGGAPRTSYKHKLKWQDSALLSLEYEKNKLQYEPRARSGSIKLTFEDLSQKVREEETFNPLKFSEKLKDVKNTKRADMISLRDKFEHQNSWGESKRREQKKQVGDIKDYFEERAKVEAKYAKDLERLHKEFSERPQKDALTTSGDLFYGIVNEAKRSSDQHNCLSQVFHNELAGKRCDEIIENIDRVYRQAVQISKDVQVQVMEGMTDLHTSTRVLTTKVEELKHATIKREQADSEKKKLEDKGKEKVEKEKKRHTKLVENCKLTTEKYNTALADVVNAQKDLILANSAVNAMTKQYFEVDLPILVNCADLGFHQNLNRLANARVECIEKTMIALGGAAKSIKKHAARLDSKLDKEKFFELCLEKNLTEAPEPFALPSIDKQKLPSPEVQQDLKDNLKTEIEVMISECKLLTKDLDAVENHLLDLMEFNDWNLTKQFATAMSKAKDRSSTSSQDINDSAGEVLTNNARKILMEKDYLIRTKELMDLHGKIKQSEAKYSAIRDLMAGKNPECDPVLSFQMRKMKTQTCGRPRVFGGDLDDFFEATRELIPPVVKSCIDTIRRLGMNHQGIFRIGGAHSDIDAFEKIFINGEDPFADLKDDTHLNSVASILKRFFHRLPEPIFPKEHFDQVMMIARNHPAREFNSLKDKMQQGDLFKEGFVVAMREVVGGWSRPKKEVVSHLFSLLADLSKNSGVTQMDPYNIAICFAPNLCPIPEGYDQMQFTNHVNILIKNFIIFSKEIFGLEEVNSPQIMPSQPTGNPKEKRLSPDLPDLLDFQ